MTRDAIKWGIAAVLVAAAASAEAQKYKFTPLSFPGGASLTANAHDNHDAAVGSAYDQNNVIQAVVWNKKVPTVLPGPGTAGEALAINREGQVVGYSFLPFVGQRAVRWDGASATILALPAGADWTTAVGINARGQVAGNSAASYRGPSQAVMWDVDGKPLLLGSLGGGTSVATGIDQAGDVVGYVDGPTGFGARKPVVWHGNVPTVLGSLFETTCCDQASAIADTGEIVGWSSDPDGVSVRAVVWHGTVPTALQALSVADEAFAVNNLHQAVGALNAGSVRQAALWNLATGAGVNLNSFLTRAEKAQGWVLYEAHGIDRRGVIVGIAFNSQTGSFSAFQLAPVSAP